MSNQLIAQSQQPSRLELELFEGSLADRKRAHQAVALEFRDKVEDALTQAGGLLVFAPTQHPGWLTWRARIVNNHLAARRIAEQNAREVNLLRRIVAADLSRYIDAVISRVVPVKPKKPTAPTNAVDAFLAEVAQEDALEQQQADLAYAERLMALTDKDNLFGTLQQPFAHLDAFQASPDIDSATHKALTQSLLVFMVNQSLRNTPEQWQNQMWLRDIAQQSKIHHAYEYAVHSGLKIGRKLTLNEQSLTFTPEKHMELHQPTIASYFISNSDTSYYELLRSKTTVQLVHQSLRLPDAGETPRTTEYTDMSSTMLRDFLSSIRT